MKNNTKIFNIFFLIIFLFSNNLFANDQFKFDVTELEIIENGNIYKGLKGGTVTSDDGLKIEANNFYYDKTLNILNARGDVKVTDLINDYIILSKKITYLKNQEKIFTKGKTIAIIESKYNFESKNIIFFKNEKKLSSSEKSTLRDRDLYLYKFDKFDYSLNSGTLKAEKIQIVKDFKKSNKEKEYYNFEEGIFNIKSKDFIAGKTEIKVKKNIFEVSKNDPRMYGVSSKKENNITTINKGVFTSCELNDKCPPWSISANKIIHDSEKKQIIYNNAFLKIYDIPVLYFPKFFHPGPSVKRQSGFLQPRLNESNVLGTSVQTPYFHVISDNKDYTVSPTLFNDNDILMIQNEYRQENKNSSFITDIGYTKGYKSVVTENKKKDIAHLFAKFSLNLDLESFLDSELEFNVEHVTNDTYLKVFETNLINTNQKIFPKNKSQLSSSINVHLEKENYIFDTGMAAFETLSGADSDRYQYVLPYYNYTNNLISNNLFNFDFNSSGSNNYLNTNNLKSEIINNFNFNSIDFFSNYGFKNNFGVFFKNINTVAKNDAKYKSSPQIELMNLVNLETSLPLKKSDDNYSNTFTPKISLRANPTNMKNHSNSDRQITSDNMFSINRLGISDSFESGQSLTLGLDYKKQSIKGINKYFDLNLGTILRDTKEDNIPTRSTIGSRQSNLFGSTTFNYSNRMSIDYDFAIDNNMKTFDHNSIGTTFNFDYFVTKFKYVETNNKMGDTNFIENFSKINFNDYNYLTFKTRRNRKISLTEYYDLVYEYQNDCLIAGIKYKKTYYQDRDLKPAEDMIFTISLFPITQYEHKIDQSLYKK